MNSYFVNFKITYLKIEKKIFFLIKNLKFSLICSVYIWKKKNQDVGYI